MKTRKTRFSLLGLLGACSLISHAAVAAPTNIKSAAVVVKPSISIGNSTLVEGNSGSSTAAFEVKLSAATTVPVTVSYTTTNDTAVAPNDYNAATNTLTFAPGETTKTINIAVKGDTIDETDERYNVNLSNPVNATINDNLGVGFITDDDAPPVVSVSNVAISEGNTGTKLLNFTVRLSVASSRPVTVSAKTVPGVATETTEAGTAGVDYVALPATTISFAPGELVKTIGVTVNGDAVDEANETFNLLLSAPGNATLGTSTAIGTITDDDVTPTFSVSDVSLTEGNSQTQTVSFNVNLSAASGRAVKVTAATADNTAQAGPDYIAITGSVLTFLPGQTSKAVAVTVKGDLIDEVNETFQLKLTNPVNATINDSTGIGTILDDDATPSLSVTGSSITEGNEGVNQLPFTVKLSGPSSREVTVKVRTGPPINDYDILDAKPDVDFVAVPPTMVTFAAGETSKVVNVPIYGDDLDEYDEHVHFTLLLPVNATIANGRTLGTIVDNDAPPTFYIEDQATLEGSDDTDYKYGYVYFGLTKPSGKIVNVTIQTAPSPTTSATADVDYVSTPPTVLTLNPGTTNDSFFYTIIPDTVFEGDEKFRYTLTNPVNATVPDPYAEFVIFDWEDRPQVTIDDVSIVEGNSGTKFVTLTGKLAKPEAVTVQAHYQTNDYTANSQTDYYAQQGEMIFPPGKTTATIKLIIVGDTELESDQSFKVYFGDFKGSPTATVTILDDDNSPNPSSGPSASRS